MSADSDLKKGSLPIEPTHNATTSPAAPTGWTPPVSENRSDSPHPQRSVNPPEATPDLFEIDKAVEERKNFFKPQKPGIQKDRTRAILKQLYLLNQRHARMVLYKDYINIALESGPDFINLAPESGFDFVATGKYRPLAKGWQDLEEHLHQYSRATKEYEEFLTTHTDRSKTSKTSNRLIEVAARITVIDDYKQQQRQKPSDELSAKIDEADKSLWKYFQDQITGKLAREEELREKKEEAEKREFRAKEGEVAAKLEKEKAEKEAEKEAKKKVDEAKKKADEEEEKRQRF